MSKVKWIKLSTEIFDDEKIRLIESMPDSDALIVIWMKLLTQAGKTNAGGYLMLNQNIPYTDEMLATLFNRPLNTVRLALKTFESFGMIEIADDIIAISNWEKHQNVDGLEKIREKNRLRKQKERENKRLSHDSHVTVTLGHDTDIEKEKEKELVQIEDVAPLNSKKKNIYTPEFEQFWDMYPRRTDKNMAFKKFLTCLKEDSLEDILKGTENYKNECEKNKTEQKFIKHPKTFLGNQCYLEYLNTTVEVKKKTEAKKPTPISEQKTVEDDDFWISMKDNIPSNVNG